jgi:hypothetical protein
MTTTTDTPSAGPSGGPDSRRNFILQQGLCEPAAGTCPRLYSALLFQPRLIGVWVIAAVILQAPLMFLALGALLWWNALVPRFNPFDALYNAMLGRARGMTLTPAPIPRRFAQGMAGTFGLAIGASLMGGWRTTAFVLEGMLLAALAALILGGFCLGSFIFHMIRGRSDFATRTLPWAKGG